MKHSQPSSIALALALGCGASVEQAPGPASGAQAGASLSEDASALDPVAPGEYRLEMSATCKARELTETGTLTLSPISAGDDAAPGGGDGGLLWGQMDLDFAPFARCLGQSSAAPGDPIHPSVLVEVLHWDGVRHHQVLLVSTDAARPDGSHAGAGVAMWVERVDAGHLAGVWSRWELMGRGEGRWVAERLPH